MEEEKEEEGGEGHGDLEGFIGVWRKPDQSIGELNAGRLVLRVITWLRNDNR